MSLSSHVSLPASMMCVCALLTATPTWADTDEVIRSILGRPLSSAQVSHAYIHADGSLEGVFNGISFAGTWTLEGGRYCRQFTRGLNGPPICMAVSAEYTDGEIRAVIFDSPSGRSKFDVVQ